MGGAIATDFADNPSLESVKSSFDDNTNFYWGWYWEVLLNRFGFGMHYMVKFDKLVTGYDDPLYDWSLDWNGDLFLSFHVLGGGFFLDPFIEIGFGNVGRVDLDNDDGDWRWSESGWVYQIPPWNPAERGGLSNLSLYPYAAAGLALDLDGFLVGAKFTYRPFVISIPVTQFADYPLKSFQLTVFAGVAFGGH